MRIPGQGEKDSGVNVKTIPGEGERDSGLKANSDSDGKANGFRPSPEWLSRCPECFLQAQWRWTSYRHNEPSKGGSDCRPGDCPCGNYGRVYASDSNSNWATSRSGEVARSGRALFTST